MFTGIIREVGSLKSKTKHTGDTKGVTTFAISCKKLKPKTGDSICVNGVCLTVTKKTITGFEVDVVAETLKLTNLGGLRAGATLNLEPSLLAKDTVDGHFVTGHVDAMARVTKNGTGLTIKMPKKLMQYIVYKGSITINGVSLTVCAVKGTEVTVALIPFTKNNTNLGSLHKGDMVNVEIDLIARYLHNFGKIRM